MPVGGAVAGAGAPKRRDGDWPLSRRAGSWVVWWVFLMAFWVWIDDSVLLPELLAGALVAAAGTTLVELVQYEAASRIRVRAQWLAPALRLPVEIGRDTFIVLAVLWRKVASGVDPPSGFVPVPKQYGEDTLEGSMRRALLVGGTSAAPNTSALGLDDERQAMIVHYLVVPDAERLAAAPDPASSLGRERR